MSADPLSKQRPTPVEVEVDHVCGTRVPRASPHRYEFMGREYLFCSERCLARFETMPEAFTNVTPSVEVEGSASSGQVVSEVLNGTRVSLPRVCLFGFFLWALVFAAGMAMYTWRIQERALFESAIAVVLAAVTAGLTTLYLARLGRMWRRHAIAIGIVWPSLCVVLDAPLFSEGPMRMSLSDYLMDIGVTYLMIPIITSAMLYQAARPRGLSATNGDRLQ